MLTFGRYEALFKIAAGGMAEVYAARIRGEAGFEKLVAIKRMLPHLADDQEFSSMFLDEARLAANIASPNVVSTLDLGRAEDGALYIAMELVVGVALSSLVKASVKAGRAIPVPIACEVLAQAAMGLDDAHEARTPTGVHLGIVHRDVSPQNVLVGADGRVRVVDFGVARALLRQTHTSTGTLKGKFAYFSPEQASAKELDCRSDVFALGIVAWETLAMRRLFDGENPLDQIQRVREMPIPPLTSLRPDVPREVSDAVMRALDRDPKKRLPTAAAFASALRDAVGVVPSREIARFVGEVSAAQIREIQLRIESALAGEHVETHVLRPTRSGNEEISIQATPSSRPHKITDLPTLIKTGDAARTSSSSVSVSLDTMASSASASMRLSAPPETPDRADRRLLTIGLGVSVLLILLLGAALFAQQPPGEPIATPLAVTPAVQVGTPAPPPVVPPPEPVAPIAVPSTPEPRPRVEPRHATTRTEPVSAPVEAPVVEAPVVEAPRHREARVETRQPEPEVEPARPEPPRDRPRDTPRRGTGLADDDAFDQGI